MKTISMVFGAFFLIFGALTPLANADTTVNVGSGDSSVTVDQNGTSTVTTTAQTPRIVVVRETPVTVVAETNPREFEGEIVKVDAPKGATDSRGGEIIVRDAFGRDRRVEVKQGMISNYKVGDYVQIQLMADLKEAKDIHTVKRTPDFEGTVVAVNAPANQIVVRDSRENDRNVLIVPDLITSYKVGDRVRLYEVTAMEIHPARTVQVIR